MILGDEPAQGRTSHANKLAVAAVALSLVLIGAGGLYNAAEAPPGALSYLARISSLGGSAPQIWETQLVGAVAAVGSHHILDAAGGRFVPLDGAPAFSASTNEASDPVAHADGYAWFDGRGHLRVRDLQLGTDVDQAIPSGSDPVPGSLALSSRWAAWNYVKSDSTLGIYGFNRTSGGFQPMGPPVVGNITLLAISGSDFYLETGPAPEAIRVYNASINFVMEVGSAANLTRPQAGAFYAAWVNRSVPQVEYYDSPTRTVRALPAPAGVAPSWVRADAYRVLFGGLKPGFLFASNQVELYDFATGDAKRFDNVGVDLANTSGLAFGGDHLVAFSEQVGPRPAAPLTPIFIAAAVASLVGALFLAARASFREPE